MFATCWKKFGLATLLMLCIAGCGRNDEKLVELKFSWPGGLEETQFYKEAIAEFNREHPDIKVKSTHVAGASFEQKILVEIAGNGGPDVFWWPYDGLSALADRGVLLPLDNLIKEDKLDYKGYYPRSLQCFQWDGVTYGLPGDWGVYLIFYNKDLFDKAKLPYPKEGWSWDEFRRCAIKLTKRNEQGKISQYGFSLPQITHLLPFVLENGGQVMNAGKTKYLLDSKNAIDALNFWYGLKIKDQVCSSEIDQQGGNVSFAAGNIGMVVGSSAGIGALEQASKAGNLRFGVQSMPVRNGKCFTRYFADGYVIYSKSARQKEAWEFIKFITGPKGSAIRARLGLYTPAWKAAAMSAEYQTSESRKKLTDSERFGVPSPTYSRSAEVLPVFQRYDELMRLSSVTVEDGMKKLTREANDALADDKKN